MLRKVVWTVEIAGAITAIIATIVVASGAASLALAFAAVILMAVTAYAFSHFYGVRRHLVRHLGWNWFKGELVLHKVKTGERADLQAALDALLEGEGPRGKRFGLPLDFFGRHVPDVGTDSISRLRANPEPVALVWEGLPRSSGQTLNCANNALYLVRHRSEPFCAVVNGAGRQGRMQVTLQVLARTRTAAEAALGEILRLSRERSVYKGSVVSVQRYDPRTEDFSVQFHELPPTDRDAIVLPEAMLELIERNVLGFLTHAEVLRQADRGTRHGVLLHGPPGTGKTLVTRYLAHACAPYTVLLLTGRQYAFLRPTCRLARLLAPSLVVLEDVDLIATDRRRNRHAPVLHELMDEMDGLGPAADCIFLLTTNRPESIESALAARPGRVDQAVYFPLPDLDCRRRLFEQFGRGLDMTRVDLEPLLLRTEGASPAFLKELFRRAVLMAAGRGEHSRPLRSVGDDFEFGLRELLEGGGELTRNFLGFPALSPGGPGVGSPTSITPPGNPLA